MHTHMLNPYVATVRCVGFRAFEFESVGFGALFRLNVRCVSGVKFFFVVKCVSSFDRLPILIKLNPIGKIHKKKIGKNWIQDRLPEKENFIEHRYFAANAFRFRSLKYEISLIIFYHQFLLILLQVQYCWKKEKK